MSMAIHLYELAFEYKIIVSVVQQISLEGLFNFHVPKAEML